MIFYSTRVEAHFKHFREVLTLLQSAGVSLKLPKCNFFETSVDYLGHVVRPGKVEVATRNFEAMKQSQAPANQTYLRCFLRICKVYRRFVPNFSQVTSPPNRKLSRGQPNSFETLKDDEYEAFRSLKDKFVRPPILALPRHGYPYTLDTEACEYQVGFTLLQQQPNGNKLPIGY